MAAAERATLIWQPPVSEEEILSIYPEDVALWKRHCGPQAAQWVQLEGSSHTPSTRDARDAAGKLTTGLPGTRTRSTKVSVHRASHRGPAGERAHSVPVPVPIQRDHVDIYSTVQHFDGQLGAARDSKLA